MFDILLSEIHIRNSIQQKSRNSLFLATWIFFVLSLSGAVALLGMRRGPDASLIAWLFFLMGAAAIAYEPRYGVYLVLLLGLMGDSVLMPWFPFVNNMSSAQSVLYLNDSIIISPMEFYMGLIFVVWIGKGVARRNFRFYKGPLFWPAMLFTFFILFGFVYGLGTGGDFRIAIWEGRYIFYIPLMIILASNLITTQEHISNLVWFLIAALVIEGLSGIYYFVFSLNLDLNVQSITEHGAAIHMNTLFVLVLALWLYKGSLLKRFMLPLMLPPVLFTYIATQRRAAFLTLAVALAVMMVVLYIENRRLFWFILPPLALGGILYIGVFWNASGALGLPVQAIKAILVPSQANGEDVSSDLYRVLENINTSFTIHSAPLTGVGFGHKFYMIVPLPDISFFEFWEYITHNSVMWIWMKAGIGGFLSMLFLIGASLTLGGHVLLRAPGGDVSAIALTMALYIMMHFLYAYVDMSWDPQSMLFVGVAMGILNILDQIITQPAAPITPKRWPWQTS
ncbi:MAG: O-antigen ligase domain-containing protein [Ardenticatenaceae bacterium]|nr:O-antigen ligase domain-containing protein [Ardenticatenaceae bacterium]